MWSGTVGKRGRLLGRASRSANRGGRGGPASVERSAALSAETADRPAAPHKMRRVAGSGRLLVIGLVAGVGMYLRHRGTGRRPGLHAELDVACRE